MPYSNVRIPRFYINAPEWQSAVGAISDMDSVFRTLPVNPINGPGEYVIPDVGDLGSNLYVALLGHTANSFTILPDTVGRANIVNGTGVLKGGFSIVTLDSKPESIDIVSDISSIVYGKYYDMINAPNLSLTLSREYGSTKEFTSINGSSLSNTMWDKPPKWGDLGAWELDDGTGTVNQSLARSGRRTWSLAFSFMDDGDLWGSNQYLGSLSEITLSTPTYEADDFTEDDSYKYNLVTDSNFFSMWNMTLGGTLPFIFQPDGDGDTYGSGNNNPDGFAICRFKNSSLKATQTAPQLYDISVSIEEVW